MRRWLLSCILSCFLIPGAAVFAAPLPPSRNPLHHLRRHPTVALTFDDLPAAGGLPQGVTRVEILTRLAAELKAGHVKGVYGFVNAVDLDDDPDTKDALRIWIASGMNIGNHTWSHPSLNDVTAQAFEREIAQDEPDLRQYAAGRDWHWFRYPNLEEGDTLAKREEVRAWLHHHGYRIAEATLTAQDDDWSDPYNRCVARGDAAGIAWLKQSFLENAAAFIQLGREEEKIAFGHEIPNVLLLHATDFTALMLPDLLHLLHQQGFRYQSLARVESNAAYAMDPHAGLAEGGTFPNLFMNSRHLKYPPFQPEPLRQLDAVCR